MNSQSFNQETEKKGWLSKWTNYIKGYQRRYFVLSDGVLSYYKNESEVNINCRGRIKLASAVIKPLQNLNFLINKGVHDSFHLRADSEAEKQKWLLALNLAQCQVCKSEDEYAESSCTDTKSFEDELKDDLENLLDKLQDIKACQEKLNKSGLILHKLLNDLDILDKQDFYSNDLVQSQNDSQSQRSPNAPQRVNQHESGQLRSKLISDLLKSFKEKNGSYKIALSSSINSCNHFSLLAQQYLPNWGKKLQKEHETNRNFEQVINQLANHIKNFEEQIKKENNQLTDHSKDDDEKFYDAEEFSNNTEHFAGLTTVPGKAHRVSISNSVGVEELNSTANSSINLLKRNSIKYEIKCKEPDESFQKTITQNDPNNAHKTDENHKFIDQYDDQYTNESSDREDELSLSSCNDDTNENNELDEMIKSSVVLVETDPIKSNELSLQNTSNDIKVNKDSSIEQDSQSNEESDGSNVNQKILPSNKLQRVRRTRIPERPNHPLNLWAILKGSIGRDLSKVPMPVNFSEPLSLLQRITGDFEYAYLLHKAAKMKDSAEQLAYVSAFCVSNYATTGVRTCKPFNPLLAETFECDRLDDLGFRSIAEQVSHHPPILAIHCEAKDAKWIVNSEFAISSKFRGKYLQVNPIDANHLEFPESNYHYTWHKVTTSVHNIIVGKLWIDNHGDMIITNHTTGDKAHIKFSPYSYFSRDVPRKVAGVVLDRESNPKWIIKGSWDSKLEISKVLTTSADCDDNQRIGRSVSKVIWKRDPFPPDSEKMYNLTKFAIELNELEEGVAPTDSRLRPDQRLMEEGDWSRANHVKMLLEQKQRDVRREREELVANQGGEPLDYQPIWFKKCFNELIGDAMYRFTGEYWNKKRVQDWSKCPDIFTIEENE